MLTRVFFDNHFYRAHARSEMERSGIELARQGELARRKELDSKYLGDGIFELRCKQGNNITRILYFFYYEGKIVLTNGFVKKKQKTPLEEISLAKVRRADFIERMNKV